MVDVLRRVPGHLERVAQRLLGEVEADRDEQVVGLAERREVAVLLERDREVARATPVLAWTRSRTARRGEPASGMTSGASVAVISRLRVRERWERGGDRSDARHPGIVPRRPVRHSRPGGWRRLGSARRRGNGRWRDGQWASGQAIGGPGSGDGGRGSGDGAADGARAGAVLPSRARGRRDAVRRGARGGRRLAGPHAPSGCCWRCSPVSCRWAGPTTGSTRPGTSSWAGRTSRSPPGRSPVAVVRRAALAAAAACVVLSLALGWRAGLTHVAAVAVAWAYNARLKSTPWSWLPYAVSFGLLRVRGDPRAARPGRPARLGGGRRGAARRRRAPGQRPAGPRGRRRDRRPRPRPPARAHPHRPARARRPGRRDGARRRRSGGAGGARRRGSVRRSRRRSR